MMRDSPTSACLRAALHYNREFGWKLFPARVEKKSSYLSQKHAAEHLPWGMTDDPEQLISNFSNPRWRDKCGVGLPTGLVNELFVIEADTPKGHKVDGIKNLRELEAHHRKLPTTLMAKSPSGSLHYYFKHPGGGIKVWQSASKLAGGVDVRGDGGMVVIPPSRRKDGEYIWLNDAAIAEAPNWLLKLVTVQLSVSRGIEQDDDPYAELAREQKRLDIGELLDEMNYPGNVHDTERDVSASLLSRGEGVDEVVDFLLQEVHDRIPEAARWNWATERSLIREHCTGWFKKHPELLENQGALPQWLKRKLNGHAPIDTPKSRLMQSSAEFVAGFVPPDYLIDGLLQRRYVYSFTGPTGSGKTAIVLLIAFHVACGLSLAGRHVEKGRVLFFAGENPDDVRTRWIKVCEEMGVEPASADVVFMPFTPKLSEAKIRKQIDDEAKGRGPFALLIVDTSAAYYSGDDENDNKKLGDHARLLRSFVTLPGGPTVIVTCHPTKTPDMENLLPRGGGAFLAEVDGNLVAIYNRAGKTAEVTTHGKFRGPEFTPFSFKLMSSTSVKLVDSKGRFIWTVTAHILTDEEIGDIEAHGLSDQNQVLHAMLEQPGYSFIELAEHLGWMTTTDGKPNKQRVYRIMQDLRKAKLVEPLRDGRYILTKKGEQEAAELKG
jgi:hypothetical protein